MESAILNSVDPLLRVIRGELDASEIPLAFPVLTPSISTPTPFPLVNEPLSLEEIGRRLWRELFLEVRSLEQLSRWESKIPNYGCSCKPFYEAWRTANPPIFIDEELGFGWKHSLKSAVNAKLGHVNLSLENAFAFWRSQT